MQVHVPSRTSPLKGWKEKCTMSILGLLQLLLSFKLHIFLVKTPSEDIYSSVLGKENNLYQRSNIYGGKTWVRLTWEGTGSNWSLSLNPRGVLSRGVSQSGCKKRKRNYSEYFKKAVIQCLKIGAHKNHWKSHRRKFWQERVDSRNNVQKNTELHPPGQPWPLRLPLWSNELKSTSHCCGCFWTFRKQQTASAGKF